MFQAAFYRSTRPGIAGMYNRLVRWWDRSLSRFLPVFLVNDGDKPFIVSPAAPNSHIYSISTDPKYASPFRNRLGFAIDYVLVVRFLKPFRLMDSAINSVVDGLGGHARIIYPVRQRLCIAIDGYIPCALSIVRLNLWRGPSAIFKLVVAVYVNSVKRMQRAWFFPHVSKEVFKQFIPAITDYYSTAAIQMKLLVIWIGASLAHSLPAIPLRSFRPSMPGEFFSPQLFRKAFTRQYETTQKGGRICFMGITACTLAQPPSIFRRAYLFNPPDHSKSAKRNSSQVFQSRFSHKVPL